MVLLMAPALVLAPRRLYLCFFFFFFYHGRLQRQMTQTEPRRSGDECTVSALNVKLTREAGGAAVTTGDVKGQ